MHEIYNKKNVSFFFYPIKFFTHHFHFFRLRFQRGPPFHIGYPSVVRISVRCAPESRRMQRWTFPASRASEGRTREVEKAAPPAHSVHASPARFSRAKISMPEILVGGRQGKCRRSTQPHGDPGENLVSK